MEIYWIKQLGRAQLEWQHGNSYAVRNCDLANDNAKLTVRAQFWSWNGNTEVWLCAIVTLEWQQNSQIMRNSGLGMAT
jgi:hypothetical protein